MNAILASANWLLPLLYLVLLIDYGTTFFLRTKAYARNPLLIGVLAFHVAFLVLRSIDLARPPLANGCEILSVLAFSTAAVYGALELAVRDRRAGVFIFLLVFIFQYTSSVFIGRAAEPAMQSAWARLHAVPAIISYTAFAVSAIYATLYLLAHRSLKRHSVGVLFDRLPPFDLLGRMSWYSLLAGFVFMTVSIATGPILLKHLEALGPVHAGDPRIAVKIAIGSIAWLTYGTAVAGRLLGKWSDRRVSWIVVAGFVATIAMIAASAVMSQAVPAGNVP